MAEDRMLSTEEVLDRVDTLRQENNPYREDRTRIRAILNGGQAGIVALLGGKAQVPQNDLPVVNLLDSGLTRLAQKLRHRPDVKVDPRDDRDSERERRRAAKRERIVEAYDYNSRIELDLPQISRWVPGYGFGVWILTERQEADGARYPHAELRDPYTCWPGYFGASQQPDDLASARTVPARKLERLYPTFARAYQDHLQSGGRYRTVLVDAETPSWEGNPSDRATLIEYWDRTGTYLINEETGLLLDHIPNPLDTPPFVIPHRFSFDKLISQYHHVIGLMAMMAKLNVLSIISAEDNVFRETNVIGDLQSGTYERGRFAVNYFTPGSRIERAPRDANFEVFAQIDRLERQMRVGTNYSVVDDSQSPNSFVTGQGTDRLMAGVDANVSEYQLTMRHALEMLDTKRLEWDEKMGGRTRKPLTVNIKGRAVTETYRPSSDIAGDYRTRRVYGVMAGWDEPTKIVTGLQLLQGEIIDTQTMQENLYGLENLPKIRERIRREKSEATLFAMLQQRATEGDPAASAALIEIFQNPQQMSTILAKFFTPQEPQLDPNEQAFLTGQQPAGTQPPPVSTVLSRLELSGNPEGGIQTVGRL